jgi:hypothetical protein
VKRMRQILTKGQAFIVLNCVLIASLYLAGDLRVTLDSAITALVAMALINGIALISANRYTDWRK